MPPNVTRPCAFVFLRAGDRVLVSEMHDPVEGVFYRPPGGGIEFRETAEQAGRRELREELDLDVGAINRLGVFEEIFELRGEPYHEIAFVFQAWIDAKDLEALDGRPIVEPASDDVEFARVFTVGAIGTPLYPAGVERLLTPPR